MPKRLTTEEFITKSEETHGNIYDYSKVKYKNTHEKVNIICLKHGDFFQYAGSHLNGKGCLECGNESAGIKRTGNTEKFIKKAKLKHGETYDYSEVIYCNRNEKVNIICRIHGSFPQSPRNHLRGFGCDECAHIKTNSSKVYTTEEFIELAKKVHGDKYDYSLVVYEMFDIDIDIICKKHKEFKQTPSRHLQGKGCRKCGRETIIEKTSYTTEEFIDLANKIHDHKYDYSKTVYVKLKDIVIIGCPIHGDSRQTPFNHLRGSGCRLCGKPKSISKEEREWLKFIGIPDDEEHRQVLIKVKDRVRVRNVDGFDPITNTVYEYNGDWWHGNPAKFKPEDINKKNKKTYGELYQATLKKEQELIEAGYKVISIWGSDWKKFKKNNLNKITLTGEIKK